ncbi:MAG: putative peptidoglycan glycosyltransferase FtsW [Candidatus Paceibacterota bacterium]|jgi:cell division protein FtsW
MPKGRGIDKIFLSSTIILLVVGFLIFISASMRMLAIDGADFSSLAFKQFFGIVIGLIACFVFTKIHYRFLRKYALIIFILSIIFTCLVFVPGLGTDLNTFAKRWISLFGFTFQPVNVLNMGFVIYWAAWLSFVKEKVTDMKYSLLPLLIILGVVGSILLSQPDTDSFFVICGTGIAMLILAGGRMKHVLVLGLVGIACLTTLAFMRPYVMERLQTFITPSANSLTSGYQVQQSIITIGSGQFFGRGWGQSIQKYKFLPQSINDSIFAVLGEELGFLGCIFVIALFIFFAFRGFRISIRAPDSFSGLLVSGIVILVIGQSFINIASTLDIIPFSGIPLAFFSQGGASIMTILAEIGIVLNISKFTK